MQRTRNIFWFITSIKKLLSSSTLFTYFNWDLFSLKCVYLDVPIFWSVIDFIRFQVHTWRLFIWTFWIEFLKEFPLSVAASQGFSHSLIFLWFFCSLSLYLSFPPSKFLSFILSFFLLIILLLLVFLYTRKITSFFSSQSSVGQTADEKQK